MAKRENQGDSFLEWMNKRHNRLESLLIKGKPLKPIEIHYRALKWARANRSDPHAYATVTAHFKSGIANSEDYRVDFHEHVEDVKVGNRLVEKTVYEPVNMTKP